MGKLNGFLLKLGEDGRLGKGGHMENHEHTPKFELDLFLWMDWEPYKANYVYKKQKVTNRMAFYHLRNCHL